MGLAPHRRDALANMRGGCSLAKYRELLNDLVKHVRDQGEFRYARRGNASRTPLLDSVMWDISGTRPNAGLVHGPFNSWIIQELDLTLLNSPPSRPVRALLIDTCEYAAPPWLFVSGGVFGRVGLGQMGAAEHAANDAAEKNVEGRGKRAFWIVLGYHPWSFRRMNDLLGLNWLFWKIDARLYISAHSHRGWLKRLSWLWYPSVELNLGSTLDWPMEHRVLELYSDGLGVTVSAVPTRLSDRPEPADDLIERWRPREGDPDWFDSTIGTSGTSGEKDETEVKRVLLHMHDRMLREFPTRKDVSEVRWPGGKSSDCEVRELIKQACEVPRFEGMVSLLEELEEFDMRRPKENEERYLKYRLWQAIWASKEAYGRLSTLKRHSWPVDGRDSGVHFPD